MKILFNKYIINHAILWRSTATITWVKLHPECWGSLVLYCQSAAETTHFHPRGQPHSAPLEGSLAVRALWHKGDLASIFFILQLDLIWRETCSGALFLTRPKLEMESCNAGAKLELVLESDSEVKRLQVKFEGNSNVA